MVLVRVWRRQLLGGMGTAMIVPVALTGALAVLALAGGFGGLSALGQAFSGPALPALMPSGGQGAAVARPVPPALVAALSAPAAASSSSPGTFPGSSTTGTAGGPGATTPSAPGGARTGGGGGGARTPRGTSRPSPPPPAPKPQPQPTAIDKVVAVGTSATSQLPAPAGPAATKALQQAGSTLDSIVPVKSP